MSVLTHNTTLPEAVTLVAQGKTTKDDLLGWLDTTYVGLSKLYLLLQAGLTAEEFELVSEAQSALQAKRDELAKASAASMDSSKPYVRKPTVCPVTRGQFAKDAKTLDLVINGIPMSAEVKEFSSGSFGWYSGGKVQVKVGDKVVTVQMGLNMTVIGSKEA